MLDTSYLQAEINKKDAENNAKFDSGNSYYYSKKLIKNKSTFFFPLILFNIY